MKNIITAAILAIALSAGAVSAQAEVAYDDAVATGQTLHPNGTAGAK